MRLRRRSHRIGDVTISKGTLVESTEYHIDYGRHTARTLTDCTIQKQTLGTATIVNDETNELDEPISMMRLETRARRATTTIRTRHLLIPHCQEDHCTRMHANTSSLIHTWTFNFLSLFLSLAFRVLYLPYVPSFYPLPLFTLLPSTMAFLSSKPPKSLTRLKLVREVTVSSIARR